MAQPTNTFDRYSAIGIREDLTDVIYNISPTETPFLSSIGKTKARSTLHEWQTDSLAAASTSNAAVEGDDASGASLTATTRANNQTQISQKTIIISGTLEATDRAGRKSEIAYQLAKASSELKRDMESILTQNQASVVGNTSTARKLRSLEAWLVTNKSRGTSGSGGSTSAAATDGTQRTFTEAILKDVVQQVYSSGGTPSMLMVGAAQKQVVSAFAGIAVNRYQLNKPEPGVIIGAADIYVSDFGQVSVVPNRFQRNRSAFVLDPEYAQVAYLRPFQQNELAKTGDAEKRQLLCEYTLEMSNEAAHGVAADLS
jgi:hypothetical protein